MYDIERYLNVRSATGSSLGPAGERLAFRLDASGTYQAYTLEEPRVWPAQRTFYEDRVTWVDWNPTRPLLAFGKDTGGDEHVQFYTLDPADGTVTGLTERPGTKHLWGGWSPSGDRFAFAANNRESDTFDIHVQGAEAPPADARRVVEGPGGFFWVADWDPAGERLLCVEPRGSTDIDVHVVDVAAGASTRVFAPADAVRLFGPQWAPDGEAFYCATDLDGDTTSLRRISVPDGAVEPVALDPADDAQGELAGGDDWDVDGVVVHHDSRRIAYSRNVDGYTELTVGTLAGATTVEPAPTPELPGGVAGGVDFGPDGERFAATAVGRRENANVHVVDVATGTATRWTEASLAGIPRETLVEPELVRYEADDGLEIPGFLSLPDAHDPPEGGYPAVVSVHGGPESQRRPGFHAVAQYLLAHGFAVFEPNVRGSAGYGREYASLDDVENRLDSVADLAGGYRYLADRPDVDGDRVAVMGGSYGGYMVLAGLTEYPDLWAAGVDIVGIANFVTFLENTGVWRRGHRENEYGSLEDDCEFLESISPINHVEEIVAPLFVIHGENDPRVPVGEARQIVEALRERDVPVRSRIFEDEGHGLAKRENRIDAYRDVVEFLDEHV